MKMGSRGAWPAAARGEDRFLGVKNCRICMSTGDVRMTRLAGEDGRQIGGCSLDSEHDLAFMVSDFLENWSYGADTRCSSDSDSGYSDLTRFVEKISFFRHDMDQREIQLLSVVQSMILSINEANLNFAKVKACNASCFRQKLVSLLRFSGIDAGVCISKWQGSGKVPGGEHEYIDVFLEGNTTSKGRFIIDIDFRSNFEIARAVKSYDTLLHSLPVVYVGYQMKLKRYLSVMVEAARISLKQNSMPFPPWRSLPYLQAKWQSTRDRNTNPDEFHGHHSGTVGACSIYHEQCIVHLKRLKSSILIEKERDGHMKPVVNEDIDKHRLKYSRWRDIYS